MLSGKNEKNSRLRRIMKTFLRKRDFTWRLEKQPGYRLDTELHTTAIIIVTIVHKLY